jgi:hypothetical protein
MEGLEASVCARRGLSVDRRHILGPNSRNTDWNTPITRTRFAGACRQRTTSIAW